MQTTAMAGGLDSKQARAAKKSEAGSPPRARAHGMSRRSAPSVAANRTHDDWPDQPPRTATPPGPVRDGWPDEPPRAATSPPAVARPSAPAATEPAAANLDTLKGLFRRPADVPSSAARDEIALGARLFAEVKLSADHKMSCATCHDPAQALTDGRVRARGNQGQTLARNTPALWNAAWQKHLYWDGRSATLEAQAKDAIERDGEMDGTLQAAALWLSREASYSGVFERVYRASALADPALITRALAAYERSLVSPPTRFDRWIDGDAAALNVNEVAGFRLFAGKARCLACHGGWRFTDDDFHDIGLRSPDRGRSALADAKTAGRAFKTPSLREAVWTAHYMHDGSLATFEAVLDHYTLRLDRRSSIAPELRTPIVLTAAERGDLIAFLRTLSSPSLPRVP